MREREGTEKNYEGSEGKIVKKMIEKNRNKGERKQG